MRREIKIDLSEFERDLLADIDRQAESIRGLFITNTPSQPTIYLEKEKEALALMADPEISESATPNLTREAARLGQSRLDCAVVILTQAHSWRQISAIIEDRRLGAKDAVRAAAGVGLKRQAAQVDWSDIAALAT